VLDGVTDELAVARRLTRDAVLASCALLTECDEERDDSARPSKRQLVEEIEAPLVLMRRERGPELRRPTVAIAVPRPTPAEQLRLLRAALAAPAPSDDTGADGERELDGWIERTVSQFDLGAAAIARAGATARHRPASAPGPALWDACRAQARIRLDALAQRIDSAVSWDDLVLPSLQQRTLHEIGARVRQRTRVYETWGFARKSSRGLGISVLFAGVSGTGKTMAAEVLANELRLDLHKVDLSQVVSKYIGETEKNLRRVFDAAEAGATVLLFDEADALFGKRSDVKDSHDRYANVEVSYLLQRMEAYRGLAILTTNMRAALDPAFLRRLAFVVEFPFPDAAMRAEIWRRVFPATTPTRGLDWEQLARLSLAGGNIRSVALGAAFLAADADEPVQMKHIRQAAESEYAKLERPAPADLQSYL
jgi:hypothetical protein